MMRRAFRKWVHPAWWWRRLANRRDRRTVDVEATPVLTGEVGVAYDGFTVTATDGKTPYVFSVFSGAFPDGIELDDETGEVAGTPTEDGSFAVVIRVTDARGEFTDLPEFTIEVDP